MELRPLPKQTLSDQVAEQLRSAIRDGSLGPGTRLVERTLAEQLGVSRIPVREGIQQLVDEGLITKIPRRGTFVYEATRSELEEIASLRVVLERYAMERVATNWNDEYREQLAGITEAMRTAALHKDYQQIFEQDVQFHSLLWQIAEHDLLLEVVSGLYARINRFLYEAVMAQARANLDAVVDGHWLFIDVFDRGDVATAKDLITEHIISGKDRILNREDGAQANP